MKIDIISAKDIKKYIYNSNTLIIDLRDKEKYLKEHIPTAISICYEELNNNFFRYKKFLERYKIIILYCEHGNNGIRTARYLSTMLKGNYTIYNVYEGYEAYKLCKDNK